MMSFPDEPLSAREGHKAQGSSQRDCEGSSQRGVGDPHRESVRPQMDIPMMSSTGEGS